MVSGGKQAATSSQKVGGPQEAKAVQGAVEGLCWPVPKDRLPQWKVALGSQPRSRQTHPAPCYPGGGSLSRKAVETPMQTTPKTMDASQAVEVDDSWAPESKDWLQPEGRPWGPVHTGPQSGGILERKGAKG